jgi:hypothetical protein
MPIVVPPFVAYTAPLIPVPCRWRTPPPEGDQMIPVEIDWGNAGPSHAVQIALTSFSPVLFSQVIALSVDNSRSGADVDFIFVDTGKQLTVPAYAQGVFPVFTNALTFYCAASGALAGDTTVFCILNCEPPPVAVLPSQEQSHSLVQSISLNVAANTAIVPPPTTGTLQGFTLAIDVETGAAPPVQHVNLSIQDGTGAVLWAQGYQFNASVTGQTLSIPVTGLKLRFSNGLYLAVIGTTMTGGAATVNVYYSVP